MNETTAKHDRVLEIYSRLMSGEIIRKNDLAEEYGVTPRSIQRDIDSIREFYSNRTLKGGGYAEIKYDHTVKGYRLISAKSVTLTNAELFAVAKIILDSRSLSKAEVEQIIPELIHACLPEGERMKMEGLIRNELFHYVEPRHGKQLIDTIWELGSAVQQHKIVHLEYQKTNGEISVADIKPVGIMCSEYYFYLIAYIGDNDEKHPGYPTIYRIDRFKSYRITEYSFQIPYRDRFQEGEFRKRIPFMYGGKLHKTTFIYTGPDINAVLDRLPTAEAKEQDDGSWLITVEVFGKIGLNMWIREQGSNIILPTQI